ncbi:MAG: hypothetical protein J7K23_00450 [Thermoproteales archaeon]|nr:hypothetical protein [Thermoproteales archaeon]
MGNISLLEKIERKIKINDDSTGRYIVIYDFYKYNVSRIPQRFYRNIYRLFTKRGDCYFIQKSVIICESLRSAKLIEGIVSHYGGNVLIYRVCDEKI